MNAMARLEDWMAGHKSRACEIMHDNGYGASCWSIQLWGKDQKKVEAHEAQFMGGTPPENIVFVDWALYDDDWPGLDATLHAALDRAEKLGL